MQTYDYFRKALGGEKEYEFVGSHSFKNIRQAAAFAEKHRLKFLPRKETIKRAGLPSEKPVQRVIKATRQRPEWDIFSEVPVSPAPPTPSKPCSCRNEIIIYGIAAFALGAIIVPWLRNQYLTQPPSG